MNLHRTLGCLFFLFLSFASTRSEPTAPRLVDAATAFLSTLDQKQRQTVLFSFDDEKQRARWSNFPTGFVRRSGLSLRELNEGQRTALMALLSSALSPSGLEKVRQIMEGDEVNKTIERDNPLFGGDLYYVSILGTPSDGTPWMLQFGGHHLALNLTLTGELGILTPTLTGAQPALYTSGGKTIRPLGKESDKAFALFSALDDAEQKQAILNYRVSDLVLGPGQDGKTIKPEGIKVSALNEKQRALLLDLISEWTGIVYDQAAAARMTEIKAGLEETWFAWSGPTTVNSGENISAYYRIQGPRVIIEYAPQKMGGDPSLHVHTMYRDTTNDYGRSPASK